jgi:hypothetical protein
MVSAKGLQGAVDLSSSSVRPSFDLAHSFKSFVTINLPLDDDECAHNHKALTDRIVNDRYDCTGMMMLAIRIIISIGTYNWAIAMEMKCKPKAVST